MLLSESLSAQAIADLSETVRASLDFFATLNPEPSQAVIDAHEDAHEDAHGADAAPNQLPWSFAVLSDLHIPNSGRVPARLRAMIAELVVKQPRFVVVTGDFTNGGEIHPVSYARRVPSRIRLMRTFNMSPHEIQCQRTPHRYKQIN